MKNIIKFMIVIAVFFCLKVNLGYSLEPAIPVTPAQLEIKTVDVNKDGKPDVTYYKDGKYVGKIEADTDYDGKPDVVVKLKEGKFQSAEVDTNKDGKTDKKFDNEKDFKAWLNKDKPEFNSALYRDNWEFGSIAF